MNSINYPLISGAFFGLTAVGLGAFGAHYLKTVFDSTQLEIFNTAIRYQMYHALILCAIGLFLVNNYIKLLIYASYFFIIGIILFSFSLYLYLLLNVTLIVIITPIGGVSLLIGWLVLLYFAIRLSYFRNEEKVTKRNS